MIERGNHVPRISLRCSMIDDTYHITLCIRPACISACMRETTHHVCGQTAALRYVTCHNECMDTTTREGVNEMAASSKTYRPEELATRFGVSGKIVRAELRKRYPRKPDVKGTTWIVPATVANELAKVFAKRRAAK